MLLGYRYFHSIKYGIDLAFFHAQFPFVIKLVTRSNGVSALLFHVEHSGIDQWHYRWRVVGPYPPAYLEWREGMCDQSHLQFHPEVAACRLEAQWRLSDSDEWIPASLHVCAVGSALFRVKPPFADFHAPNGFRVVSLVPGEWVACYIFPPLTLAQGQQASVTAIADGPFPDNVLLAPGNFSSYGPILSVDNLTASEGSFQPASDDPEDARLSAVDGCSNRRLFVRSNSFVQVTPPESVV